MGSPRSLSFRAVTSWFAGRQRGGVTHLSCILPNGGAVSNVEQNSFGFTVFTLAALPKWL